MLWFNDTVNNRVYLWSNGPVNNCVCCGLMAKYAIVCCSLMAHKQLCVMLLNGPVNYCMCAVAGKDFFIPDQTWQKGYQQKTLAG